MTRRERAEARLERRREWAAGRTAKAEAGFAAVNKLSDSIPFGQPILVGHHSERHARRDADRIHNGMSKACESQNMAEHHESKAAGIERQLATTIFSDDPDAVEAIKAKVAAGRAKIERMKAANKAWRKSGVAGLVALGWSQPEADACAARIATAYSWEKQPYAGYELTNLGGNMRRLVDRIKGIERQNERRESAAASDSGVVIEGTGDYVSITFAEKPERSVINDLKAANFYWGNGSWSGKRENIPASVQGCTQDPMTVEA